VRAGTLDEVKTSTRHRQNRESDQSNHVSAPETPAPSEPHVGQILRRARQHRGWSLRDVERRTGIPNPHLSQIERGQIRRPDSALLWTLTELYDLDFAKIAAWSGHLDRPTGIERDTSLLLAALRALSKLDPVAQADAISYIERLAERPRPEP
jgi:transcriptional regulator with XRE-family HTH domain